MKEAPSNDDLDREALYGQLPRFSRVIGAIRGGSIDAELTDQLRLVCDMVRTAYAAGIKKPGVLSIKVTVDPIVDDQVAFQIESQAKGPKLPPNSTILFVDEHNLLATENPYAYRLPLGEDLTDRQLTMSVEVGEDDDKRIVEVTDDGEVF